MDVVVSIYLSCDSDQSNIVCIPFALNEHFVKPTEIFNDITVVNCMNLRHKEHAETPFSFRQFAGHLRGLCSRSR